MDTSRREFLQWLVAFLLTVGIKLPAFEDREPYVKKGSVVSYIGPCPGGFIGAESVRDVGEWDGIGYPVTLYNGSFCFKLRERCGACEGCERCTERFYDFDLIDFTSELPEKFWWDGENCRDYPNVHTWARVQRFGETIEQAIMASGMATCGAWAFMVREGIPFDHRQQTGVQKRRVFFARKRLAGVRGSLKSNRPA